MKIAVIAANGRSGKAFVELALAAGHDVRAGIFGANNLTPHEHLTAVPCDATNQDELENLLQGQDAVVSLIGHVKGSPPHVQADAMRALIPVMRTLGMKRMVSLTGTGVRCEGDKIPLIDRVLNLGISLIDPARVADGREHLQILKESNVEWTVIRVLKLQNVQPSPFTLTPHGPTKWYVGREEVAQAMLQALEKNAFIQQAPIISKP